MDLFFSQSIVETKKTSVSAKTLIDHILTSFPEKMIQTSVIEMRLIDHELIYYSRKTSVLNELYEISLKSMKNY